MWLNERGYRSRSGALFGTGTVHEILTRSAYVGEREFNAADKSGERKSPEEIVTYQVPQIIDPRTFEAVQALLLSRQPAKRGPRLDSAPSLLGGLIRCDCEHSHALTASTGTSRTGKVYSYYKCIQATKQGRHHAESGAACCNRRVPRTLAEQLVTEALLDQLFATERVIEILLRIKQRRDERQVSADQRIATLAGEVTEAELRLGRIYKAIEEGALDPADPTLRQRVDGLRDTRDRAREALDYAKRTSTAPFEVDPVIVERFVRDMRERMANGDTAARKAYLAAVVDAIVVTEDRIRIIGSNDSLEAAVNGRPKPKKVRSSVQEWCPWPGSNQHSLRNSILSRARLPIPPQGPMQAGGL